MITGLDLVEWQLRVAAGEALPRGQEDLHIEGHAIEARLYAENPDTGFLPSIGTLAWLELPPHAAFANGDVRVDGGVRQGDAITPFYDPMIAKLIVRGADRDQARRRMLQALALTRVAGVQTNVAFLARLMADEAYAAADLDTGLIERRRATLLPAPARAPASVLALACAYALARQGLVESGASALAADPWDARDGWRLGGAYAQDIEWLDQGETRRVAVSRQGAVWRLDCGAGMQDFSWRAAPAAGQAGLALRATLDGCEFAGTVVALGEHLQVFAQGGIHALERRDALAHAGDEDTGQGGRLTAPMPGKVVSFSVQAGDKVRKGQALAVMEAMKMEHTIAAPADGTVSAVFYAVGEQVAEGAELIAIE
jgi:3-methylcrotonyl-CoA carboxylase alpha subunit